MFDKVRVTASSCATAALIASGLSLQSLPTAAQDLEIGPPDVYEFTVELRQELDEIAIEMGEPVVPRAEIEVENVSSRYAFFQAVSVFQKASALCFEFTQSGVPLPRPPQGEITSKDVLEVVTAVNHRVKRDHKSV